jgi:hypothetical protein
VLSPLFKYIKSGYSSVPKAHFRAIVEDFRFPGTSADAKQFNSGRNLRIPAKMRRNLDGMRRKRKIGRRVGLGHFLEAPRQTITDLLNGRQNPTGEEILAIQEFSAETPLTAY